MTWSGQWRPSDDRVTGSRHLDPRAQFPGYGDTALGIFRRPTSGHRLSVLAGCDHALGIVDGQRFLQKPSHAGELRCLVLRRLGGINPDPDRAGYKHTNPRPLVVGGARSRGCEPQDPLRDCVEQLDLPRRCRHMAVSIPAKHDRDRIRPRRWRRCGDEGGARPGKAPGLTVRGFGRGYLALEAGFGTYTFVSRVDAR